MKELEIPYKIKMYHENNIYYLLSQIDTGRCCGYNDLTFTDKLGETEIFLLDFDDQVNKTTIATHKGHYLEMVPLENNDPCNILYDLHISASDESKYALFTIVFLNEENHIAIKNCRGEFLSFKHASESQLDGDPSSFYESFRGQQQRCIRLTTHKERATRFSLVSVYDNKCIPKWKYGIYELVHFERDSDMCQMSTAYVEKNSFITAYPLRIEFEYTQSFITNIKFVYDKFCVLANPNPANRIRTDAVVDLENFKVERLEIHYRCNRLYGLKFFFKNDFSVDIFPRIRNQSSPRMENFYINDLGILAVFDVKRCSAGFEKCVPVLFRRGRSGFAYHTVDEERFHHISIDCDETIEGNENEQLTIVCAVEIPQVDVDFCFGGGLTDYDDSLNTPLMSELKVLNPHGKYLSFEMNNETMSVWEEGEGGVHLFSMTNPEQGIYKCVIQTNTADSFYFELQLNSAFYNEAELSEKMSGLEEYYYPVLNRPRYKLLDIYCSDEDILGFVPHVPAVFAAKGMWAICTIHPVIFTMVCVACATAAASLLIVRIHELKKRQVEPRIPEYSKNPKYRDYSIYYIDSSDKPEQLKWAESSMVTSFIFNGQFDEKWGLSSDELRNLLGEFFSSLNIPIYGEAAKNLTHVGLSHNSRCFNLNWMIDPDLTYGKAGARDIVQYRKEFCYMHGWTCKNIAYYLDNTAFEALKRDTYQIFIIELAEQGEDIQVKISENGEEKTLNYCTIMHENPPTHVFTLESQYKNHPHAYWDEFIKALETVITTEFRNNQTMRDCFEEYIASQYTELYFKCQIFGEKKYIQEYLTLVEKTIYLLHKTSYEKMKMEKWFNNPEAKYEGGKRVYAYMTERICSFYCYYLMHSKDIRCMRWPVNCYKGDKDDLTRFYNTYDDTMRSYYDRRSQDYAVGCRNRISFFSSGPMPGGMIEDQFDIELLTCSWMGGQMMTYDTFTVIPQAHGGFYVNRSEEQNVDSISYRGVQGLEYARFKSNQFLVNGKSSNCLFAFGKTIEIVYWDETRTREYKEGMFKFNSYGADVPLASVFLKEYCSLRGNARTTNRRVSIFAEALSPNDKGVVEKIYFLIDMDKKCIRYAKLYHDRELHITQSLNIIVRDNKQEDIFQLVSFNYKRNCFVVNGQDQQSLIVRNWDDEYIKLKNTYYKESSHES